MEEFVEAADQSAGILSAPGGASTARDRVGRARRRRTRQRDYLLADVAGISLTAAAGAALGGLTSNASGNLLLAYVVTVGAIWIVVNATSGAYTQLDRRPADPAAAVGSLFNAAGIAAWAAFAACETITSVPVSAPVVVWLLAVPVVATTRALARQSWARSTTRVQRTVILGAGEVGRLLARKIQAHPEMGLKVVGFVDANPKSDTSARLREMVPVLGSPDEIAELVVEHDVDRVIIAFSIDRHDHLLSLIRRLVDLDVEVDLVPRLFEVVNADVAMGSIEGLPLQSIPTLRLSPTSQFVKRVFDLLAALVLLLVLLPSFVLIALAIKLDSKGPVFFRQLRIGSDGPFTIFKFRSMHVDADAEKERYAHLNLYAADHGDARMFKIPDDPRVTRVGTYIRRYFLDELPQFFNVLRGEMSLVGPRPLIPEEDQHVLDWQRRRLAIKPGITGLWQVLGSNEIPFDEMVKLDYLYASGWSLSKDIRLLLQTVPAVFRRRYY